MTSRHYFPGLGQGIAFAKGLTIGSLLALGSIAIPSPASSADPAGELTETMLLQLADQLPPEDLSPLHLTPCISGSAGGYPCDGVDLLEFMPLSSIGGAGTNANDSWGWTDIKSGREFALVGLFNGTSFVEITNPEAPVYLGKLPTFTSSSTWRDIKVYSDHAYIVSDFNGCHGMQVFDLTQLLSVVNPPVTFSEVPGAHYGGVGSAHNIVMNEASGFAYIVGSTTSTGTCPGTTHCSGGLHIVNLQNPEAPVFAGCFSADGYTHDAQCVNYIGPDPDYAGHEICIASNEDTITIVDVTNKSNPIQISRNTYPGSAYTHQSWLTEDQHFLLVDDELDESGPPAHNTWTYVWDVSNLDSPQLLGHFTSTTPAIDHNQYIKGTVTFQANYRSGLRILRLVDLATATLSQVGYFDIYPSDDNRSFNGAWNVYPFFPSENIIVTGIEQGLFILHPTICVSPPAPPLSPSADPAGDHQIDLEWFGTGTPGNTFTVERALGGCAGQFETIVDQIVDTSYSDTTASGQVTYGYRIRENSANGICTSDASACVTASTTGSCTAPPLFSGIASAANGASSACEVTLSWPAASALCGGVASFTVYRGSDELFVPSSANRVAEGVHGGSYVDVGAPSSFPSWYIVHAVDEGNGSEDSNQVRQTATATGPNVDGTFSTGAEIDDPPLDTLAGDGEAPEHAGWHPVETRQHSGARSFGSGATASACLTLEAGLTLTPAQSSQLSFWTTWALEPGWDGGIVQISTDGGASWNLLTPAGGYPDLVTHDTNACSDLQAPPNRAAFSSDQSPLPNWVQKTVSLAAYAGQSVLVAWRYGADSGDTREGWYVDDISVTHTQIPASCSNDAIFIERYEGGDFGAWGQVTP